MVSFGVTFIFRRYLFLHIFQTSGVPLHKAVTVYKKFPKRSLCWSNWAILPQFCTNSSIQRAFFVVVEILYVEKWNAKHGIFKSFLRVRYCTLNFFCPFDHLFTVAVQRYFISYMFIFHDFKSDMMRFGNEKPKVAYTHYQSKEGLCLWQIHSSLTPWKRPKGTWKLREWLFLQNCFLSRNKSELSWYQMMLSLSLYIYIFI